MHTVGALSITNTILAYCLERPRPMLEPFLRLPYKYQPEPSMSFVMVNSVGIFGIEPTKGKGATEYIKPHCTSNLTGPQVSPASYLNTLIVSEGCVAVILYTILYHTICYRLYYTILYVIDYTIPYYTILYQKHSCLLAGLA